MKQHTQIGATVKEAVSLALHKLGKTPEQVDVEVLQKGKKGFLGFGSRPAEVRVTVKDVQKVEETELYSNTAAVIQVEEVNHEGSNLETSPTVIPGEEEAKGNEILPDQQEGSHLDPIEETKAYIASIATSMGISDLVFEQKIEGKYVSLHLQSKDAARLIGKRGQTLNSLQQLAQLILNKSAKSFLILKLDVEDYRERRQEALEQLADRMADKAIRTKSTVAFEPMPSSERKIIHNALANRLDIETHSEGTDPHRYLVIEPLR